MDAMSLASTEQEQEIELEDSEEEGEENGKLYTVIVCSRSKGISINFSLCFVTYSLYQQLFEIRVIDLNEHYILTCSFGYKMTSPLPSGRF
jgi:hypothetical protein